MKKANWMYVWTFLLGAVFLVSAATAGMKVDVGDDGWMSAAFLGQAHYAFESDAASGDEENFYLRRGRIILKGQITDGIKFFMETDNDNAGRTATAQSTDIQDAWVDVRICGSHWIQGGLILLPFSLENRASAASLLGIDYNAEAIKFVNAFVWRDVGAELHGNVAEIVAYRVGVFDGYSAYKTPAIEKNTAAGLRYTGRVDINVLGKVEKGGWFYSQNRLGKAQYLVVGAGIDSQAEATTTIVDTVADPAAVPVVKDSSAWVVDFQSSVNLGPTALLLNGAYYDWDNGGFEGNTAFVEGGLLIGKTMVTAKYSLDDPADGDSTADVTAGLHCFLKGHNMRVGVEYRTGDKNNLLLGGIQVLL